MKPEIRDALNTDRTIDIVTVGAKSGLPRRTEIWFINVSGRIIICGTPGAKGNKGPYTPRDWLANLKANPGFTFCFKESLQVELPARAVEIVEPADRRYLMSAPETQWYRAQVDSLEDLVQFSPIVEVFFDENRFTTIQPVLDDLLPIVRSFAVGRYAVAISGSYGKGTPDRRADIDLRLYTDELSAGFAEMGTAILPLKETWGPKGIQIDDFWPRKIGDIEAALESWLAGKLQMIQPVWTVWGYQLLPDLYHQQPLEDPAGIVADWKARIAVYPASLQKALLDKHLGSLRYWRHDYHYANKAQRGDLVFLAGLTVKLVHDIIQVLFALNETYYVGDGYNLDFLARFAHQPHDLAARLQALLYPPPTADMFVEQRERLLALIDEVEALAMTAGYGGERWVGLG